MAQRTETMNDVLNTVLGDVTGALTLPDADIQFLTTLQTILIKKIREPNDLLAQMQGQQSPSQPQAPQSPQAPQMPAAPPVPQAGLPTAGAAGGMAPPGVPGVMSSPNMAPAADELRRMTSK